jgi:hypothetical protein
MKKPLIISLVFVLICLLAVGYSYGFSLGPEINGPPEFKADIDEAMELLRKESPKHYKLVKENLGEIRYNTKDKNGIAYGLDNQNIYYFSSKAYTNYSNPPEYKSIIIALSLVHEATHGYRNKKDLDLGLSKEEIEKHAVDTEIEVANLIGAPEALKEHLKVKLTYRWWEQGK